jgi:hypothetical protein
MTAADVGAGSSVDERQSSSARADGSLKSFDESVGPRMSRLRSGVTNVEFLAGVVEVRFELATSIRQHPAQLPPGSRDLHRNNLPEEQSCLSGVVR